MPLESGYFEAYNRDNVELVDIYEDEPLERITSKGVKTAVKEHEFDILIYATGFDGVTGAFDRIDIRGSNGIPLKRCLGEWPASHLSRHARRRLPEHDHGARTAHGARQHPACYRARVNFQAGCCAS